MTLPETDRVRLAQIRMHNMIASASTDTSTWESTFFLRLIDQLIEDKK